MATTGVILIAFVSFIGVTLGQPCLFKGELYNVGSYWQAGSGSNKICECTMQSKVTCYDNLGHCRGIGDVHYTSFDRKYFDFQGICRYELVRDCNLGAFSIAVQQEKWSVKSNTSISEAFGISYGIYHLRLYKTGPIVEVIKNAGPPIYKGTWYDDDNVRCEMAHPYMMVTLKKHKIWFQWDFNWRFEVWADRKHQKKLCGICGNWDGNPNNDVLLTPNNNPQNPNIVDWGIAWRTVDQPARCENGIEPDNGPSGRKRRNAQRKPLVPLTPDNQHKKKCNEIFQDTIMAECKKKINPVPYINSCELELAACEEKGLKGCMSFALDPFMLACKDKLVTVADTWKKPFGVQDCNEMKGGITVKYQHLSEWTDHCQIKKCINGKTTTLAKTKCTMQGCKWQNERTLIPHNKKRNAKCYIYTCDDGKWHISVDRNCCKWQDERSLIPHGEKRLVKCHMYTCNKGKGQITVAPPCCAKEGTLEVVPHLAVWTEPCKNHTCINGKTETKITCTPKDCKWTTSAGDKLYRDGAKQSFECFLYTCNDGIWKNSKKKNCCYDKAGQEYKC